MEQAAHPLVKLGARHDLIAARHLDELQARTRLVIGLQCLDRRRYVLFRFVRQKLEQHLRRQRLRRREDQCFDDRLQFRGWRTFVALSIGHFALSIEHCHPCGSPIGCGASTGRARLYTRMTPDPPDWNTRTSFNRIISSSARNVTIMKPRDPSPSANRSSKPHASLSENRARSWSMRVSIGSSSGGSTMCGRRLARSSTFLKAAIKLKRSTSSSASYSSPAASDTAESGRMNCALLSVSRSCSSSAAALYFWCSSNRRTSASRGSSSGSSS